MKNDKPYTERGPFMLKYLCYKYLIFHEVDMIVRNCGGGIVFRGDKVLLVCNDKHEWGFPKGVIRSSDRQDQRSGIQAH